MLQPTTFYHGARGSMAATDYKHAIKPPIITAVCSDETYWFTRRQLRQMIDLRGAGRSTSVACQGGWMATDGVYFAIVCEKSTNASVAPCTLQSTILDRKCFVFPRIG